MGLNEEFDDRTLQTEAESEQYHPYEYQTEGNTSWAGALPVKQCVRSILTRTVPLLTSAS
jgi:glutamate synthase (NADH)